MSTPPWDAAKRAFAKWRLCRAPPREMVFRAAEILIERKEDMPGHDARNGKC